MKKMMKLRTKKMSALGVFGFALFALSAWIIALYNPKNGSFAMHIMTGFPGNLTAGLIGGLLFLVLAFYINADTEEKISNIFSSSEQFDERYKIEQKLAQFKEFMAAGDHYNVRFPQLKEKADDVFGLEYKIWACRDESNQPKVKKTQFNDLYVVRVEGPACEEVLSKELLEIYKRAPIKENCFYFCRFYNGDWHMGPESSGAREWFEFYMSSKLGDVEHGESANRFMAVSDDPEGYERLAKFHLTDKGKEWTPRDSAGVFKFDLFADPSKNLFLKIDDSQLKKVYYKNSQRNLEEWTLEIDDMGGYFFGPPLANLKGVVVTKVGALGLQIPKIPWHHFEL
jgi:hypothetical protein